MPTVILAPSMILNVCLSVCYVCHMITLEILDLGSAFSHIWYTSREYGSRCEGHRFKANVIPKEQKIPIHAMWNFCWQ